MNDNTDSNTIKKRKIFYLSGYDPRGIRFYYQTLKTALEKFCTRDKKNITLSSREKKSALETHATLYHNDADVQTDYCFLHWDDIIKKSWIRSNYTLFGQGLKSYAVIFWYSSWKKALKMPRLPLACLLYPFLSLVTFPLITSIIATLIYHQYGLPFIYPIISSLIWIQFLPKLNSNWLLRFFIFNEQKFMNYSAEYDKRAKEFSDIISKSFHGDYDEIILIAHSNGSIATMPILNYLNTVPDHFKILTLGHCTPLINMNEHSQEYINITHKVSQRPFKWFDIGFPPDGACYAKTNPLITYKQNQKTINTQFKPISAQFFKYYSSKTYNALRKNKFDLHFSYLVTHDKKSDTEFINIISNNHPLETLFS